MRKLGFELIGDARTIAQRIVAANQATFQAAAAKYKQAEMLELAQSIAVEVRNAALKHRLEITTMIKEWFMPADAITGEVEIVVGNLRRESMMKTKNGGGYTGSGVDDIVRHFVMGWSWDGQGGGYWHGKRKGFRTSYAGSDFIGPILDRARASHPDITITAPSGWE